MDHTPHHNWRQESLLVEEEAGEEHVACLMIGGWLSVVDLAEAAG